MTNTATLEQVFGASVYRANLCIDGESPSFRGSGGNRQMVLDIQADTQVERRRRRLRSVEIFSGEPTVAITVQKMLTRK
jgi:hypothetical protein